MVESRALLLDGLTSGGHGSRIVNPQRAQAASEKGAAYERLGFPANQKRIRHRILSFFSPPSSFKAKKKKMPKVRCGIQISRLPGADYPPKPECQPCLLVLHLTKWISVTDLPITAGEHMAPGRVCENMRVRILSFYFV